MNQTKKPTSEHTPEPWPEPSYQNDTGPNDDYFDQWHEIAGIADFNKEADAKRARACVNALAGLNPDAVKDVVEALEILLLTQETCKPGASLLIAAETKARVALAKLKGVS